ncbi:putative DNA-binding transcriptional regulator AlpA [Paraburkholderia sp. GAS199]|uniref:helix-turn-helix transcriptional regulator n=1 Tax=Paraburkholderia sp. GAS199 TaxID=3035126 RepID=UPI003D25533E
MAALNHNERSMTLFFDMDALMGRSTARQRSRSRKPSLSETSRGLFAYRSELMASSSGGGASESHANLRSTPTPRTPRSQRRTSARKPTSGDGDSEGEPAPRSHIRPIFYGLEDVAAVLSLSPRGVQRLVQEGGFPKPRAVSTRRVAWLVREVEQWAESREVADMLPPHNAGQRRAA